MPAHLLFNCLYALLLVRVTAWRALAAGFVGSVALCLHNPVPHILLLPWLIWMATRPGAVRLLALMAVGYLPLCLLLGIGWFEFTNHLRSASAAPGVAADTMERLRSLLSVFSAPTATVLLARFIGVAKVWVWSVPGLLILAICGAVRWRRNTFCLLFAASALTTLIGYIFVPPDQGHGWGYRYFHSAWMALPLLATAALFRPVGMQRAVPEPVATGAASFEDPETKAFVTACILLTLVVGVGYRAYEMEDFLAYDLSQLPHYHGTEPRVVILDIRSSFYGGDLVQNDPWLRDPETRMISHGPDADREMMAQYYPTFHMVHSGRYGAVWSAAPVPPRAAESGGDAAHHAPQTP
jgi:hypothetical protein